MASAEKAPQQGKGPTIKDRILGFLSRQDSKIGFSAQDLPNEFVAFLVSVCYRI